MVAAPSSGVIVMVKTKVLVPGALVLTCVCAYARVASDPLTVGARKSTLAMPLVLELTVCEVDPPAVQK